MTELVFRGNQEDIVSISNMIGESGVMLPKTEKEIEDLFKDDRAVSIIDTNGKTIAFGAITFVFEEEKMVEIGAIIVDSGHRGIGIGKLVTETIIELASKKFPEYIKIALCNENSLPMFLNLGAIEVEFGGISIDSKAALSECVNCPRYKEAIASGKRCCDTLVVIP